MKYLPFIILFTVGQLCFGQDKTLLQQKKQFDNELKSWTIAFSKFNLSDFKVEDTLHFENNSPQDFKTYKKFLSIYKPIISYPPDGSKFIDIYSYQLNLEKKGNHCEANPEIDQAVFLCDPQTKFWNRIYFGSFSQWVDEAVWLSKTKFLLVGIIKSEDDKRKPLILFGDTDKQTLVKYVSVSKNTFQSNRGYSSPKLKRMNIEGL